MISGEVIWITGASSGLGKALAIALASNGNTVIASARSHEPITDLAKSYDGIRSLPCDVTEKHSMAEARQWLEDKFGYIDRIIINAGACEYFDIETPDWAMMERVMRVNFFGAVNTIQNGLPLLTRSSLPKPHILVTSSLANVVPFPRAEAYGASKAALHYFFDALRIDLAASNIAVSVVQPGFIKTPMTDANDFPMPFLIDVEEAVATILKKMESKPRLIAFPCIFAWLLYRFRGLPSLWFWIAETKLRRGVNKGTNA